MNEGRGAFMAEPQAAAIEPAGLPSGRERILGPAKPARQVRVERAVAHPVRAGCPGDEMRRVALGADGGVEVAAMIAAPLRQ